MITGLSGESDPLSPTSAEHDRVAQRFRVALANSNTPKPSRHVWLPRLPFSRPRFVAGLAMASAAVILALFSVGIRFDLGGGIESIVVSGRIDTVSASSVTVNTGSGTRTVALSTTSGFFDAFGNPVDPSWLQAGHTVSLTAHKSGNDLVAERLELSGQLVGTIVSVDTSSITLRGVNGDYVVQTTPATKLEGVASPGSQVEIQLNPGDDGNLVANEIEFHGGGGEDQGHEGNDQKDDDSTRCHGHAGGQHTDQPGFDHPAPGRPGLRIRGRPE